MAQTELKRLGFVQSYASAGYDYVAGSKAAAKAKSLYETSKESSTLKPGIEKLESAMKLYASPLYQKAAEAAPTYLAKADAKVDGGITAVKRTYEEVVLPSKPVQAALELRSKLTASHPENLELFKKARDEYFKLIESSMETLKSKGVSLSSEAHTKLKATIAAASTSAPAAAEAAFQKAVASWEKIAATPAVATALEKVLPTINAAKEKALGLLTTAQETAVYKAYVAPTLCSVTSSKYYGMVTGYVKPLIGGPVAAN